MTSILPIDSCKSLQPLVIILYSCLRRLILIDLVFLSYWSLSFFNIATQSPHKSISWFSDNIVPNALSHTCLSCDSLAFNDIHYVHSTKHTLRPEFPRRIVRDLLNLQPSIVLYIICTRRCLSRHHLSQQSKVNE